MSRQLKIIISGGGTGGHIFPAIAIARALELMRPGTEILFVGANGRMEMEKVPAAGYKIQGLDIAGISRSNMLRNLSLPMKVMNSVSKAKEIITQFKPDAIVGVGGYASGPTLWAGIRKQVPTLVQEQNSYPGVTNKILSRYVKKICVAYPGMEKYFPKDKIIVTGNPVRQDITELYSKRVEAAEYFGLNGSGFTVLVIGGSLGARTINESIAASLNLFARSNIQLVWQTGKQYYAQAQELQKKYNNIKVYDFISKMDYAYAVADAVVSRAGAISLSELCITGLPCILVPSPNVSEDHQTKNAMVLVNHNAAMTVKDVSAISELGNAVVGLSVDSGLRESLSKNISTLAIRDSAARIANEVIKLTA
ncbi:MAG TPA: undecaprenyldiphospho-muramoylpentapeptide beta-N-acetylglucosaminyltransferase [Bacteroidia bacterium]|nr:undecaprenyldiphospho-muramoylpentapeptide beta-N-acetylglucosaminyltransferase [Bacteroidia bacterium]